MVHKSQKRDGIVSARTCVIALLINLLVFPPAIFADGITWTGGGDGSTYGIDANWTGGTYPNGNVSVNIRSGGALGAGVDANVTLDSGDLALEQGVDAVSVNSLNIRGGRVASSASLTVQTPTAESLPNLTIGNPLITQGNVLSIGNRGSLNVTGAATTVLDLSGGGGLLYPGAANSVGASIGYGGSVNMSDSGTLAVQNSLGGTRVITNNGTINLGGVDGAPATLALSNVGASQPTTFVLGGNGTVNMNSLYTSSIVGTTGTENLVIGAGQTIQGQGFIGQQPAPFPLPSTLGSVTNYGALTATSAGLAEAPLLVVTAPLTNYDASTSRLTNGSYNALSGAQLYLTNVGSIQSLNLANVQLQDAGTGAASGPSLVAGAASSSDALATLAHVTDGNLDLQGSTETIAPSSHSGTLTLRSDPLGLPTNLTVEQDSNGNPSIVTIAGNLKNESQVYGAAEANPYPTLGAVNGNPGTELSHSAGSSVNVSGSNLTVTGNLTNEAKGTPLWSNLYNPQEANSNINIVNGGSLTVGGNLTTHTNFEGNSNITLEGFDNGNNAVGATLTVNGNLRNGGGFGTPMSSGADNIAIDGGTLSVAGNFTNNNAGYGSMVGLYSGSTVTVGGWFGQFQGNGGNGSSVLDIEDASTMTVGNLRNSTAAANADTPYFEPQSTVEINGGGSLRVNGTFANLSGGTLTGGLYAIGGSSFSGAASVLDYNGAAGTGINTIGANTVLVLDDGFTGITGKITNNGSDALSPYLGTVNGGLALYNGANLNLANSLTIGSAGQVFAGGYGTLSAAGLSNNGSLTVFNYDSQDGSGSGALVDVTNGGAGVLGNLTGGVLTGGLWNLNGIVAYGQGTDGSQAITQFNGVNMALGGTGGLGHGNSAGSTTDALSTLTYMGGGSNLSLSDTTRSFGGNGSPFVIDSSSTLTAYNSTISFASSPAGTLSVTNSSALTLNGGSESNSNGTTLATLDLSGNSGALIDGTSQMNVNDGATLSLTGGSVKQVGIITDNGVLNINGASSSGVLSVSDGGAYGIDGSGNVSLSGLGQMNVASGKLVVNANLTNFGLDGNTGLTALNGGQYVIGNSGLLQLTGIGGGGSVQELTGGAVVSLTGSGLLTGDGVTNALTGITQINSLSALNLVAGGNVTITPGTSQAGANEFLLNNNEDAGGSLAPTLNLRQGTNLTVGGSFQSTGGNVNITNGSSLTVTNNFANIDGAGSFGSQGANPINLLLGSNSSLVYNGADITSIASGSSLTLGNREGQNAQIPYNGTGTIQNLNGGQHDALSSSLTTVNGAFNLQNGAQFTLNAAAGSFQNNGSIGITSGSTLDVSGVGSSFTNVDGNGNLTGNFLVGGNSTLVYNGADITAIGTLGTDGQLTLDGGNGQQATGAIQNTNGGAHDALSATLNSVTGSSGNVGLTLQNGANLILTGQQGSFNIDQNWGVVNIINGSNLNVSNVGSGFGNVDGNGNLTGHSILIGTNSSLVYSGADITAISGSLTLDNSNNGTVGMIQNLADNNPNNNALSYSLNAINGTFNLQNGANTSINQSLTVNPGGTLNIDQNENGSGGSGLTVVGKLTTYNANTSVGSSGAQSFLNATGGFSNISDDNNTDTYGSSNVTLGNASVSIAGKLLNGAFTPNGGYADAELNMGYGNNTTVTGELKNLALLGTSAANGNTSNANVNLSNGAQLTVYGNVKNIAAQGQFDYDYYQPTSLASVNLSNSSTMTVNGNMKSYSGGGGYYGGSLATVNVNDASTLTVTGLFTNSGGSVLSLDNDYYGGSQFQAGSVNNYNSTVTLNYNSQMQVTNGFRNLSDDSANSAGYGNACLAVGSGNCSSEDAQNPQGSGIRTNTLGSGSPSEATITGGLVNSASTSNGGYATSSVFVNSGSYLNVDNLTNSAMAATPGGYDYAYATLTLGTFYNTGGTLNVTGNVTNSSSMPVFQNGSSLGSASAQIDSYGGTMTVGGTFTNTAGSLYMDRGATATVAGLFTNDSNSSVILLNNQVNYQNTQSQNGNSVNSNIDIGGSITTLNATGEFDTSGSVSIGANTALNVLENSNGDPSTYNQTGGLTTLYAGGTLSGDNVNITNGTLQGIGGPAGGPQYVATVVGNLTIGDNATLDLYDQNDPGDPMALDVNGNYDQTALSMLDLSLDGPGNNGTFLGSDDSNNAYDQVDVTGNITALDGTLNIELDLDQSGVFDNVVLGDYFNVLNWTGTDSSGNSCVGSSDVGCFGTFNDVTFTDANGNLDTFAEQINTDATGQELDLVVESVSATPEPGTLSMLFCAMLIGGGVTWYRRKRKNVAE